MKLYELAHSRTGDKGNISTISVIAYRQSDYPLLEKQVTEARVLEKFKAVGATGVQRYTLPTLGALNFVLHNTLGGGVTRSLALDAHGKSLSGLMLDLDIDVECGKREVHHGGQAGKRYPAAGAISCANTVGDT